MRQQIARVLLVASVLTVTALGNMGGCAPPLAPVVYEVAITPSPLDVAVGGTADVTVQVTRDGVPQEAITVELSLGNSALASLSPTSVETDADGRATTEIRGIADGTTTLRGTTTNGSGEGESDLVTVTVITPS